MGFSEMDSSKCRRHPNLRQNPGVCSSCLREKLSKLSNSPSFNRRSTTFIFDNNNSSLSSSPPYSTASSSSITTTAARKSAGGSHRRNGSEAYVSVGMVLNDGLKKSRSVSCASLSSSKNKIDCVNNEKFIGGNKSKRFLHGDNKILEDENMNKKKNGFLKKLIHSTGKKTKEVLIHSKTLKERSHTLSSTTSTKNKN